MNNPLHTLNPCLIQQITDRFDRDRDENSRRKIDDRILLQAVRQIIVPDTRSQRGHVKIGKRSRYLVDQQKYPLNAHEAEHLVHHDAVGVVAYHSDRL